MLTANTNKQRFTVKVEAPLEIVGVRYLLARREYGPTRRE
jgi:hypothetical protein